MSNLDILKMTDWWEPLSQQLDMKYWLDLDAFIDDVYQKEVVYPERDHIFRAFTITTFEQTKVVLLGQDPYSHANQAMGLSFSVPYGQKLPKSLINIYKELASDLGVVASSNGDLTSWAKQGVLLLNAILTVPEGKSNGHADLIWERFTNAVINIINQKDQPVVYLLWGKLAARKIGLINNPKQLILTTSHPSPLSAYRGFFGSHHFSKTNQYFIKNKVKTIDWTLK